MSILFILILVSLAIAALFLLSFFWAIKDGQFEDAYTPSIRMLIDDNESELPSGKGKIGRESTESNHKSTN